jgi:hypothetical protein
MFFGLFQYSFQGQYTYSAAIQSINPYGPQTAGNILSIIGMFSTFNNVVEHADTLTFRRSHRSSTVRQYRYQGHLQVCPPPIARYLVLTLPQ